MRRMVTVAALATRIRDGEMNEVASNTARQANPLHPTPPWPTGLAMWVWRAFIFVGFKFPSQPNFFGGFGGLTRQVLPVLPPLTLRLLHTYTVLGPKS
ncbi:hypothetical protein PIB30_077115 [Stylosanthes scabra]|uniref:Uncharacterized protein n=1 Tax=Stylosanthes scabra TaxID=79078 RepID=A0ABU6VSD9_9FABA|nr:hypothetical protein [Stylosanthes scabra]